jgi:sn-glycerol 3-phosphate transport system substrate-binding protein
VLYYNKAHWAKAGLDPNKPPQTLDELYEQAKVLKQKGVSAKPLSLKLGASFFTSWMSGIGVDVVNHDNGRSGAATKATFDTPEARDLLTFLQKMNKEGLVNVFADTEGSIDHYLALANQQSSMLIETSTASSTIAQFLGGKLTAADAGVNYDTSQVNLAELVPGTGPFPGIKAPGKVIPGGGIFYILNTSSPAQQAAAWKFLEFMLQPDNAKEWHLVGGYLPVVKAVQDDPHHPAPLIGPYTDYPDAIQKAMEAVMLDGKDPASALKTAQSAVDTSLQRYEG